MVEGTSLENWRILYTVGSNPTLSLFKAKDGLEPSLMGLQSITLPLCYLANFMKNKYKKSSYQNTIILQNGSTYNVFSMKKKQYQKIDVNIFPLKNKNIKNLFKETRISSFLKKINS